MKEIRSLVLVWLGLLVLLSITVAGSFAFTGPANLAVSWGTAAAKAALILWFYMHLREESGLARIMAVGALAWLAILLLLTTADYATRALG
jgi:cytochrome c oxidase subunit 4